MKKLSTLALLLGMAILTGCSGYHLGATKPHQLANVTKLAVPTFKNDTLQPRLEVLVTNALIKKLQNSGAYQIVPVSEADAVLKGVILNVSGQPFRSVRNNTLRTAEILTRLMVKYTVEDSTGKNLIVGQKQGQSNIVLDPNFQLSERQALADAAERLSIIMASELTEGW